MQLINQFEDAIRAGEIAKVQREMEALSASSIARPWMAGFADIARRVRSESWGLRLLRPIIRSETPIHPAPTDAELCAYAGLLIKVGALPEAKGILDQLNSNENINVLTFQSQICIAQWNYREAVVYLKKILAHPQTSLYQRTVAQVNLAGALVFLQKWAEAKRLLPQVLKSCVDNTWELLYGNALEISAQLAVIQGEWSRADLLLKEAQLRAGQHSHYMMLIEKWSALAEMLQTEPESTESQFAIQKMEAIKAKAQSLNSWETVRDMDFHLALYLKHENLLLNVYFGTPHLEYKKRIERIFKAHNWKIPEVYLRKLSSEPASRILDLSTGQEDGREMVEILKPGKMLHRFLNILARDFYKPIGLGELFSKLFPGEYFNPDSSADRVAQAVQRLRNWLELNEIPMDIKVENSRYAIKALGPYAFKIEKRVQNSLEHFQSGYELQMSQLKSQWPYRSFSASKAAEHLGISATSARNLLQKALDERRLFHSGAGRSRLYRFEK